MHAVVLSGLQDDCRYQVNISATERGGATADASLALNTAVGSETNMELQAQPLIVPVEIRPSGEPSAAGMPMTFGLPVPQGRIMADGACTLRCDSELLPAQARVYMRSGPTALPNGYWPMSRVRM